MITLLEKSEKIAAELAIDTDDLCDVSYKGMNVGPFFIAKITGCNKGEIIEKTRQIVENIAILSRDGEMKTVNEIYSTLLNLKEELKPQSDIYAFENSQNKWHVSFIFVRDKVYTVEA